VGQAGEDHEPVVPVRNEVTGVVMGASVQAGVIHGGVHIHQAAPVPAAPLQPMAVSILTMPRDVAAFTGREVELHAVVDDVIASLDAEGGPELIIYAIDGMPGVGKSAFAVHTAHRLADRFPDWQLSLHGHTPGQRPLDPAEALASLLLATGVHASSIPDGLNARSALWRQRMDGKTVLLVLDNAMGHEQVLPLLPASPGCVVLITSRRRLEAIEDVRSVSLETLAPEEAATLFVRVSRTREDDSPALAELVESCGYLPLAIRLVAGRLRHHRSWTLRHLSGKIAATKDRLAELRAENLSVAAAFDLSYQDLAPEQQRLFRHLGLHPGSDVDAYAAAALDGVEPETAELGLDALFTDHLVDEPLPGRFRCHDLVLEYARALAAQDVAEDNGRALDRLADYYVRCAETAAPLIPGYHTTGTARSAIADGVRRLPELSSAEAAKSWLDAEHANACACVGRFASTRPAHAVWLAHALHPFLEFRGLWGQALAVQGLALAAARDTGDLAGEAVTLTDLGRMQRLTDDYPAALESLTAAHSLCLRLGDELGQANALKHLGSVQYAGGDYPATAETFTRAHELYVRLGDQLGQATILKNLGELRFLTGDYAEAGRNLARAHSLNLELGNVLGQANALNGLGRVQYLTKDYSGATETLTRAHGLYAGLGSVIGQANALIGLGRVRFLTGDLAAADGHFTQAQAFYTELGHRHGQAAGLKNLGRVRHARDDHSAALAALTESYAIHVELGDRNGQAELLNDLGELARSRARPDAAAVHYGQALELAGETGSLPQQAIALEGLGHCLDAAGDLAGSATRFAQASEIRRRLENPGTE
jgi:tetratricopeptide (TPR) repeat protein